jgi:hypothetical protein
VFKVKYRSETRGKVRKESSEARGKTCQEFKVTGSGPEKET